MGTWVGEGWDGWGDHGRSVCYATTREVRICGSGGEWLCDLILLRWGGLMAVQTPLCIQASHVERNKVRPAGNASPATARCWPRRHRALKRRLTCHWKMGGRECLVLSNAVVVANRGCDAGQWSECTRPGWMWSGSGQKGAVGRHQDMFARMHECRSWPLSKS